MDVLNWFPVHGDQVKGVARGGIPVSVTSYLRGHLFTWLFQTCFFVPNHIHCTTPRIQQTCRRTYPTKGTPSPIYPNDSRQSHSGRRAPPNQSEPRREMGKVKQRWRLAFQSTRRKPLRRYSDLIILHAIHSQESDIKNTWSPSRRT